MLTVADLDLVRGGRRLFSPCSFRLGAGEAVIVAGPNGAGKTSLLRAIVGLLEPVAGSVVFDGYDDLDRARAEAMHLHGWHDGLKTTRRVREELGFWAQWSGGSPADIAAASEALELEPLLDMDVRRLSAGQRRRVALARLLCPRRPLWLLDEPLAPLDATMRARFGWVMAEHLKRGGAVLAAAHDPLTVAHRTLRLHATEAA